MFTLMADGHVLVTSGAVSGKHSRFDRQGTLVYSTGPNSPLDYYYSALGGLPNGHGLAAVTTFIPGSPTVRRLFVEERDPTGMVVRMYESTDCLLGVRSLAVDQRSNLYVAYFSCFDQGSQPYGRAAKLLFSGPQGVSYCSPAVPNSTGHSATIRAAGLSTASGNNLTLLMADVPPGAALLPTGSLTTGLVPHAGGSQGTLCLGGQVGRFDNAGQIRVATDQGEASLQLELRQMPTPTGLTFAMAGQTWNFQAWYRDANPALTSNFTDAVAVTLQ